MKKIILIILLLTLLPNFIQAEPGTLTPARMLIVGGVVVGAEVAYIVYNLFQGEEEEDDVFADSSDTNVRMSYEMEELENYEMLESLMTRSKLFDVIAENTNYNIEVETETNEEMRLLLAKIQEREPKMISKGLLTEDELELIEKDINIKTFDTKIDKKEINKTNEKVISIYDVTPVEAEQEFHYKVTNKISGEVFKKSRINYYEVGKGYFSKGEKEEAKEYFLKTIALDDNRRNRAKAIIFLKTSYNMRLDDIVRAAKKYKNSP